MRIYFSILIGAFFFPVATSCEEHNILPDKDPENAYRIVDTGQSGNYSSTAAIPTPPEDGAYYGQDGQYTGNQPAYADNGDGTVSDQVTGLTWSKAVDPEKVTLAEALRIADTLTLGGYTDWRVPTIKELYSLILFSGYTGSGMDMYTIPEDAVPYIDTQYFDFSFGNVTNQEERYIDAQWLSSTIYTSTTMNGDSTLFGVNFADGRIKGYGYSNPLNPQRKKIFFVRFVRGNPCYGQNLFIDNGNGTVSDLATGLMWQQADDGQVRDWEHALAYAEDLQLADHDDWRLPNAKELQSIVDYSRSPDKTGSPAIDPVFYVTEIKDPEGTGGQYPYFWTSTTHLDGPSDRKYSHAVYIAFGKAQGMMSDKLFDVHGAGAQRSDPKSGDPEDYPQYFGPQGDVRYVFNHVRAVRDMDLH